MVTTMDSIVGRHDQQFSVERDGKYNIGTANHSIIGAQTYATINYNDCIKQLKE